ncbi:hypothetical protein GALMADRAFT_719760 [Galerina marginata CBS 339.88]|uniref:Uncharacterized protein n=1 Tax=Galerina marginata (strain CBS 339.88) TaxID=685588 RepID=A0A067TZY4_GALM3|nr:hypothetical protein GALMADRAFT_719760 [Galerina marginata CBS 339.88]
MTQVMMLKDRSHFEVAYLPYGSQAFFIFLVGFPAVGPCLFDAPTPTFSSCTFMHLAGKRRRGRVHTLPVQSFVKTENPCT